MKNVVHLVYPSGNLIRTPESIGTNVAELFEKNGYIVKLYNPYLMKKIDLVKGKRNYLIGHALPNPFTTFRMSLDIKEIEKKILLQPFCINDRKRFGYLRNVFPKIDSFAAICGKYWGGKLKNIDDNFFKKNCHQIDLAIRLDHYKLIKTKFNEPGKRKFLYIGNKHYSKNLQYFSVIAKKISPSLFGSIQTKINNVNNFHKYVNFSDSKSLDIIKDYDFLLMTGKLDPNPTVVLEAMAWGLIPITTKGSGYTEEDGVILLNGELHKDIKILDKYQHIKEEILLSIQSKNIEILKNNFNWERFSKQIIKLLTKKQAKYKIKKKIFTIFDEIFSREFFLKPRKIINFLKNNI